MTSEIEDMLAINGIIEVNIHNFGKVTTAIRDLQAENAKLREGARQMQENADNPLSKSQETTEKLARAESEIAILRKQLALGVDKLKMIRGTCLYGDDLMRTIWDTLTAIKELET